MLRFVLSAVLLKVASADYKLVANADAISDMVFDGSRVVELDARKRPLDGFADARCTHTIEAHVTVDVFNHWLRVIDFGETQGADNFVIAWADGKWRLHFDQTRHFVEAPSAPGNVIKVRLEPSADYGFQGTFEVNGHETSFTIPTFVPPRAGRQLVGASNWLADPQLFGTIHSLSFQSSCAGGRPPRSVSQWQLVDSAEEISNRDFRAPCDAVEIRRETQLLAAFVEPGVHRIRAVVKVRSYRVWMRVFDFGKSVHPFNTFLAWVNDLWVFNFYDGTRERRVQVPAGYVLPREVEIDVEVHVCPGSGARVVLRVDGEEAEVTADGFAAPPVGRQLVGASNWVNDAVFDGVIAHLSFTTDAARATC